MRSSSADESTSGAPLLGDQQDVENGAAAAEDPAQPAQRRKRFTCQELFWCPETGYQPGGRSAVLSTYTYAAVHGATDQLLPASFKSLEIDLRLSPVGLGTASSCSRIAHAIACPLWGLAIDCCGRRRMFASTALGWGLASALFFFVWMPWQVMPLMCFTGLFMAAMGPLSQKVLSEEVPADSRGTSFGTMHFFQSLGRIISLQAATSVSGLFILGAEGWRYAFAMCGLVSIVMAICLGLRVPDSAEQKRLQKSSGVKWFSPKELLYVLWNGSFWSMLLVGILNGIPRSALNFCTMWFQYCGITDWWSSFIVSASWIAAMFVAPFVGCLGDYASRLSRDHGRPLVAQISLILRSGLMAILLTCIPLQPSSFWIFLVLSVLIGFLAGWPGVGVNRPILSEIVKPQHRATVFALVSTCEGIGAALLGAPLVGFLSQTVFGYISVDHSHKLVALTDLQRQSNARALSRAMLCMTVGPWIANVLVYCILHKTYRKDRQLQTVFEDAPANAENRIDAAQQDVSCGDNRPQRYKSALS
ncbi:transporter, major facilitator family protein [Toxoplasma gondii GT1]|uniref:Transporter, major facilitator family protein n=2 Tax=Toxoplasma gondii TaxID=5811 RepID=S7UM66_TOXGG|nr:transporter, major facilitator family protein [Toxoplasma gondii GT1]RQX67162.1 transporter, major facilitator family protein [Toxoplasma gondii CAST]